MKNMKIIAVFLIAALFMLDCAASFSEPSLPSRGGLLQLWPEAELGGSEAELKRRPGRDTRPPESAPAFSLTPRPESEDGVVRRVKLRAGQKLVALTFDACELATGSSGYDFRIVDFLRRNNIPATFFMGGKWMRNHMERAMQIMADPLFEIANHAWSHGNLGVMDENAARDQILWAEAQYEIVRAALEGKAIAAGLDPALMKRVPPGMSLFRLPYGRCSDKSLRLLGRLGYTTVQWDVAPELAGDNSGKAIASNAASRARPGSIILFHANAVPRNSHILLENMVNILRAKGYGFVTAGNLLSLGQAEISREGYFNHPGDNLVYDNKFGRDGTGIR